MASGLPVSIAACVSPGTAGLTRSSTRWGLVARRSRRSTSSGPSITIVPTPASSGVADVAVALGVAVQQDVLGVEAGGERDRQLAGGRDVAAEPLLGEDPRDRRARQRLGGEVHVGVGVAAVNASRYSRAVSRSPSSSTTNAGVPNSAATSASAHAADLSRPSRVSAVRGSTSKSRSVTMLRSISARAQQCQLDDRRSGPFRGVAVTNELCRGQDPLEQLDVLAEVAGAEEQVANAALGGLAHALRSVRVGQ